MFQCLIVINTKIRRLLITDPEIQREEVIAEYVNTTKPTVLLSPSLHVGLDIKDNLSRFQIITKVPYPNKSDRWIDGLCRIHIPNKSDRWIDGLCRIHIPIG